MIMIMMDFIKCILTVYLLFAAVRKPQFTELLKDTSVAEGKSVLLECRFTGEPPPQIQWLRNDVQILPSAVYKVDSFLSRLVSIWSSM